MKKVYIAHPLRGRTRDVRVIAQNVKAISGLCRALAETEPELLIISPVHAFSFVSPLGPQGWVLKECLELLSLADKVWVFGDWESSEGCQMEIERAQKLKLPVLFKTKEDIF